MKNIHFKQILNEIISLAKTAGVKYDGNISQKCKAVVPNCPNWLFLRPSYTQNLHTADFRPFMLWLILQNKPIGEYAERLLYIPRVKPQHPFMGKLLKKCKGVFTMKTIKNPLISTLTPFPLVARFILGLAFGLPIACLVIGFLSVMGV
ncbi:hypothetical protein [Moraxella cuniculi]|nr:hypothetical protein [Moraxella cuniculi]